MQDSHTKENDGTTERSVSHLHVGKSQDEGLAGLVVRPKRLKIQPIDGLEFSSAGLQFPCDGTPNTATNDKMI